MNNRPSPRKVVLAFLALVVSLMLALPAEAQKKKKKGYTGTGAGIGALLGLALGNGNILEDTARGVANLATDQAVLDMRSERREIGIVCQ